MNKWISVTSAGAPSGDISNQRKFKTNKSTNFTIGWEFCAIRWLLFFNLSCWNLCIIFSICIAMTKTVIILPVWLKRCFTVYFHGMKKKQGLFFCFGHLMVRGKLLLRGTFQLSCWCSMVVWFLKVVTSKLKEISWKSHLWRVWKVSIVWNQSLEKEKLLPLVLNKVVKGWRATLDKSHNNSSTITLSISSSSTSSS